MKTLLTHRNLIMALVTIVFTLTFHSPSDAQTFSHIYVDAVNGANAPTGRGSAARPYQSITFALLISERNNLPDPWHVHIHPGNYNGDAAKGNAREIFPLKLRREMIFEGTTTAEECIIDGQHTGDITVPLLSGEDTERVTIRNLTVQNSLRTNGVGGIVLHDPTGTNETPSTLENCIIDNNRGGGLWSNMPLILTGNTFSSNHGSGVWCTKSVAATNNTFRGYQNWHDRAGGLYIQGSSTGDISQNLFENNWHAGLQVEGTLEGTLTGNIFTGNTGVGASIGNFTGNITDNKFISNDGGGLYMQTFTGDIVNNEFTGNHGSGGGDAAIHIFYSVTGNITGNIFTDNMFSGVQVGRGSMTGHITGNKFIGSQSFSGLWINGTLTGNITKNEFTRNKYGNGSGGGFWVQTLVGNVSHNVFDSNSAQWGGAFELGTSTNTVVVFNNVFFNNTSSGTGNSVLTRHPTHFMNNLFMISDELSEGVSGAHTVWLNSPECRFHNNIFTGVKTAISTEGTLDLPITHNLFHNVKVDFVEQAGNNLGNDLLFWELVAVNATNNLEGDPQLVDPVTTRDFHLQATSPAIDAGTNDFAPEDDLDGAARPIGATVDIGPYEYGGTPVRTVPVTTATTAPDPVVSDDTPTDDPPSEPVEEIPVDEPPVDEPPVDEPPVDEPSDDPIAQPPPEPTLKLYWVIPGHIQRADLDGSNIEDVLNGEVEHIALDAVNGKLYWSDVDNGIFRANLVDGTNVEQLIDDDVVYFSGGRIALDVPRDRMYWTNGATFSIFRANLDGTNSEELIKPSGIGVPMGIALDTSGGKIYWTQLHTETSIFRADLDGSNVEPLVDALADEGGEIQRGDIALDVSDGKMYWTNGYAGISVANLDGSNITTFATPDYIEGGLTLNLFHGTMYWADFQGAQIWRSNLNGSQQRAIFDTQSRLYVIDIALYASVVESAPPPSNEYPAWDVNEDGKTDITDLVAVATALGSTAPENPRVDVNGDGTVNIQDIILVATHIGEVAGPAAPTLVASPERLTPDTLQQVLDLLRSQDDGSLAFRRAIANIAQLLASLTPKETALLPNYPNPFNPETWIPYQLAEPAEVTLHIYAVDGNLVRMLSLGHKEVGIYQNRTRAAYWDGKNEVGEPVASGVYFYTLTANDFTATRKMIIRK